jgi:Cdc6-like AAA superfamily ATPase
MESIRTALQTPAPGSPAIALVTGLSGTGKTQISLKYAYDNDDQ